MVLCNSQREEGLVPSQICRTSNRVIPQNYKINLEPIFNFLRLFYWIIVEKTSMSRSAGKTFFTSAQVAQKLFFIMLLLDTLVCTPSSRQRNNLHFTHENPSCIPYGAGCYAASRRSWTSIGVRTPRPRWRRWKL